MQAYAKELKPILQADRVASRWQLFGATMGRRDVGAEMCAGFRQSASKFGGDAPVWNELVDLAARKINLEHNAFNLHFSTDWLSFHIAVAIATFGLLIFQVAAVLYFYGL